VKNAGILILIGAVAVIGLILFQGEKEPELAPSFSLVNLDGQVITLSSFRGEVVLLDFWASWCHPCTVTFPAVVR